MRKVLRLLLTLLVSVLITFLLFLTSTNEPWGICPFPVSDPTGWRSIQCATSRTHGRGQTMNAERHHRYSQLPAVLPLGSGQRF